MIVDQKAESSSNYKADIIIGRDERGQEIGFESDFIRQIELMEVKVKIPVEFYTILQDYVKQSIVRGELPEGMCVMDILITQGLLGVTEIIQQMKRSD
jgi:hypothetical protein